MPSVPRQFLAYFQLLVLQYSVSLILMKYFVLLPSPNSMYIRGRMTSLQGFPNSFSRDNTGKATVDGVRSDGCGCTRGHTEMGLVPLSGPSDTTRWKAFQLSCLAPAIAPQSPSAVVLWHDKHGTCDPMEPPLHGPLPSLSRKRHLKSVNHAFRSQQTSVQKRILGTYSHIWCFLIRGWLNISEKYCT